MTKVLVDLDELRAELERETVLAVQRVIAAAGLGREPRMCPACSLPFIPKSETQDYCSRGCKQRAWRGRKHRRDQGSAPV